jgi:hypothetical protein
MAVLALAATAPTGNARVTTRGSNMKRKSGDMQSMWDTIKSWFKNSVTILWARVQVLAGLIAASAMALAADPDVTGAIQVALQPKYVPYYVVAIGLITEIARRRTASA